MRDSDIKILWGRSGNRCAICGIELTPEGEAATLGEMAHIIARASSGPRGDSDLQIPDRDNYSNLILLCPTHHTQIDKNPAEWTIEKLHERKTKHERWVSEQLDQGNISIKPIDNIFFLNRRIESWRELANGNIWVVVSIIPLNINGDVLNPLNSQFIEEINKIYLPPHLSRNAIVNSHHTRPNENGLINDDFRDLPQGNAHRIQVFRNGHCEFLICLQGSVNEITSRAQRQNPDTMRELKVLRYTDLADCLSIQVKALLNIWKNCLYFKDMSLTGHILNTKYASLYTTHHPFEGPVYGHPVESDLLERKSIISKETGADEASDTLIKGFVNCFGLVLDKVTNNRGEFVFPRRVNEHS